MQAASGREFWIVVEYGIEFHDHWSEARMSRRVMSIVIAVLALSMVVSLLSSFIKLSTIRAETRRLLSECAEWEKRIADLERQIVEASSDERIERIAREQLGLVKQGETLFIVAEPSSEDYVPVLKRPGKVIEIGD